MRKRVQGIAVEIALGKEENKKLIVDCTVLIRTFQEIVVTAAMDGCDEKMIFLLKSYELCHPQTIIITSGFYWLSMSTTDSSCSFEYISMSLKMVRSVSIRSQFENLGRFLFQCSSHLKYSYVHMASGLPKPRFKRSRSESAVKSIWTLYLLTVRLTIYYLELCEHDWRQNELTFTYTSSRIWSARMFTMVQWMTECTGQLIVHVVKDQWLERDRYWSRHQLLLRVESKREILLS